MLISLIGCRVTVSRHQASYLQVFQQRICDILWKTLTIYFRDVTTAVSYNISVDCSYVAHANNCEQALHSEKELHQCCGFCLERGSWKQLWYAIVFRVSGDSVKVSCTLLYIVLHLCYVLICQLCNKGWARLPRILKLNLGYFCSVPAAGSL